MPSHSGHVGSPLALSPGKDERVVGVTRSKRIEVDFTGSRDPHASPDLVAARLAEMPVVAGIRRGGLTTTEKMELPILSAKLTLAAQSPNYCNHSGTLQLRSS